jgi:hypothetical protein
MFSHSERTLRINLPRQFTKYMVCSVLPREILFLSLQDLFLSLQGFKRVVREFLRIYFFKSFILIFYLPLYFSFSHFFNFISFISHISFNILLFFSFKHVFLLFLFVFLLCLFRILFAH